MNLIVKRSLLATVVLAVVGGGYAAANKNGKAKKKDETTYEYGQVERADSAFLNSRTRGPTDPARMPQSSAFAMAGWLAPDGCFCNS